MSVVYCYPMRIIVCIIYVFFEILIFHAFWQRHKSAYFFYSDAHRYHLHFRLVSDFDVGTFALLYTPIHHLTCVLTRIKQSRLLDSQHRYVHIRSVIRQIANLYFSKTSKLFEYMSRKNLANKRMNMYFIMYSKYLVALLVFTNMLSLYQVNFILP